MLLSRVLLVALLGWSAAAQNVCRFYLLDHYDYSSNVGVALSLSSSNSGPDSCTLSSVNLSLAVGNGSTFTYAGATPAWQLGHTYTVKAVLTAEGPQQLFLDGQPVGSVTGAFQPMPGALYASEIPSYASGQAQYLVTQTSLEVTTGSQTISLPLNGPYVQPSAPLVLLGGTPLWDSYLTEDPSQTLTITATFQIQNSYTNPLQYDPYIDQYGQSAYGSWPSKVKSDSDLAAAIATEQNWFIDNPPFSGLDAYGGPTLAGWHDVATGYFHTVFHNNRWWLISPLGNPTFYISLSAVEPGGVPATPITGRTAEFAALPSQTGEFAAAYSTNYWGTSVDQNTSFVHFNVANKIRRYGGQWMTTASNLAVERLGSWGFAGVGKWSSSTLGVPSTPVLVHGAVPNVVAGGHPDIFDPSIVAQLKATLTSQIGSDLNNPYIVGWSLGNELAEDIQPAETQAVLSLGASAPAKQALVNQALAALYGGSVSALAAAWKITAATVADIYAATPTPPAADIEALRQFYEQNYYKTIYKTIKALDPHHLYLGNWLSPGYWVNATDWALIAANTDVIGFDYYALQFLSTYNVDALVQTANKPVMIGEFSFPGDYDGQRGFGSSYVAAETDSESGDLYNRWLEAASANRYCVGVSWFMYEDQPVSGEGNQSGSSVGDALVFGEDYAFGLVDITDQPKYDLVNKVRAGNQAALQSLGLLGPSPMLTAAAIVNAASYTSGVVAPGELVTLFAGNAGPSALAGAVLDGSKLSTETGSTRVLFNGYPSAMMYAKAGQVSAVVPYEVAGQTTAQVQVEYQGVQSAAVSVPVAATVPGIFTADSSGKGQAAITNQDGTANSPAHPATVGSACVLFATGLGQTNPPGVDGELANDPVHLPKPVLKVTLTVGGVEAEIQYAGAAPTFVAGLMQINFQVPAGVKSGNQVPIVLTVGTVAAPAVTMVVK